MTNVTSTRGLDVDRAGKNQAAGNWGGASLLSSLSLSHFLSSYLIAGQSVQLRKENRMAVQLVTAVLGYGGAREAGVQAAHFNSRSLLSFPTCRMG